MLTPSAEPDPPSADSAAQDTQGPGKSRDGTQAGKGPGVDGSTGATRTRLWKGGPEAQSSPGGTLEGLEQAGAGVYAGGWEARVPSSSSIGRTELRTEHGAQLPSVGAPRKLGRTWHKNPRRWE